MEPRLERKTVEKLGSPSVRKRGVLPQKSRIRAVLHISMTSGLGRAATLFIISSTPAALLPRLRTLLTLSTTMRLTLSTVSSALGVKNSRASSA